MGIIWTKLRELLFSRKIDLVVIGLEGSGKSTFANQLAFGSPKSVLPTIGLNVKYAKKDRTIESIYYIY